MLKRDFRGNFKVAVQSIVRRNSGKKCRTGTPAPAIQKAFFSNLVLILSTA